MSNSLWLYSPWNSPDQNTGVGSYPLLQEIFLTQESNPGFLHCRQILYQLSHKGSPRTLEWVACPFSSRYSCPRNQTVVSYIAGGFFFTSWATNGCWIFSKAFSASIEIIIWFLSFSLLIWCITLIDLWILKNHCNLEIKPTWSWCVVG